MTLRNPEITVDVRTSAPLSLGSFFLHKVQLFPNSNLYRLCKTCTSNEPEQNSAECELSNVRYNTLYLAGLYCIDTIRG